MYHKFFFITYGLKKHVKETRISPGLRKINMGHKLDGFKALARRIYGIDDIEIDRQIVLLNIILTIGIVFLIPYIFIAYAQGGYLLSLFDFIAVILMILSFFYLHRSRDYEVVAYFGVTLIGVQLLYVVATGGVNNTGILWAYIYPMLLMLLLGIKKGTVVFLVFISPVLLMFYLPGNPFLLTTYSSDFKLRFITTYIAVFTISFFTEWVRAKTQEKITGKTTQLEEVLKELKNMEAERIQLQDKLMAAKKLEAIGTMAGGIAHELNNQLTIVSGNTDLLLVTLGDDKELHTKLKAVKVASDRIATLTDQLLSFSRQQFLQPESINLNELINRNSYSLRKVLGSQIELALNLDPALWNTKADAGLLKQSIADIVMNARDAMPNGGKLTIQTRNTRVESTPIDAQPGQPPGPYVCLSIQDTGMGMDNETAQKVFDPFFTTKKGGERVGLALSSVYGIIKQHRGWIDVSSEPGRGTAFNIYIPAL